MGKKEITKEELLKIRSKLGIYVTKGSRIELDESPEKGFYCIIKDAGHPERDYPISDVLLCIDQIHNLGYELKFPKFNLSGIDLSEPTLGPPAVVPVDALIIFMESANNKSAEVQLDGRFDFSKFNELMSLNGRK